MRFGSELELEDFLYDKWWSIRETRLHGLALRGKSLIRGELWRQVRIPGSSAQEGTGIADLVEFGLSADDRSCLLVHVVELKNEPAKVSHVHQVLRYQEAIEAALWWVTSPKRVEGQARIRRLRAFSSLVVPDLGELAGLRLREPAVLQYDVGPLNGFFAASKRAASEFSDGGKDPFYAPNREAGGPNTDDQESASVLDQMALRLEYHIPPLRLVDPVVDDGGAS